MYDAKFIQIVRKEVTDEITRRVFTKFYEKKDDNKLFKATHFRPKIKYTEEKSRKPICFCNNKIAYLIFEFIH